MRSIPIITCCTSWRLLITVNLLHPTDFILPPSAFDRADVCSAVAAAGAFRFQQAPYVSRLPLRAHYTFSNSVSQLSVMIPVPKTRRVVARLILRTAVRRLENTCS